MHNTQTTAYTGHVILIMAPSGSGKSTLVKYIFGQFPELVFAVSCTTRNQRQGETDGTDYNFLTEDEFRKRVAKGDFLEWAEFADNLYGTLKSRLLEPLKDGKLILKEIELQGLEKIKGIIPPANRTVIYIDAGPWEDLSERIKARAPISEEAMELRRQRYQQEITYKPQADIVISNQSSHLDEAKAVFHQVIMDIIQSIKT